MDKNMASRMLNAVVALEGKIGELDVLVSLIDDEKERDEYACALATSSVFSVRSLCGRLFISIRNWSQTHKLKRPRPSGYDS